MSNQGTVVDATGGERKSIGNSSASSDDAGNHLAVARRRTNPSTVDAFASVLLLTHLPADLSHRKGGSNERHCWRTAPQKHSSLEKITKKAIHQIQCREHEVSS